MKYRVGNLIKLANNGEYDVVVHGCNCLCRMGRGFALAAKEVWPQVYDVDKKTTSGDRNKLGTYSQANCKPRTGENFIFVNAYTQFNHTGEGVLVDYDAVRNCMKRIKENFAGKKIAMPKIGAGLARGDWKIIEKIIAEELDGEDVTIVVLE